MNQSRLANQRLAALFLLGCALFNFPFLAIFNREGSVYGIPLLYFYIFAAWGFLIAALALVAERGNRP